MAREKVRVAVNGYGVIGKRVAGAVLAQPDMELAGVADVVSDYRIKAVAEDIAVYASLPKSFPRCGPPGFRSRATCTNCWKR